MFEIRWIERNTGKRLMNEWGYYYDEIERVLQYRTKQPATDYSNLTLEGGFNSELIWSNWMDVPTVNSKGEKL